MIFLFIIFSLLKLILIAPSSKVQIIITYYYKYLCMHFTCSTVANNCRSGTSSQCFPIQLRRITRCCASASQGTGQINCSTKSRPLASTLSMPSGPTDRNFQIRLLARQMQSRSHLVRIECPLLVLSPSTNLILRFALLHCSEIRRRHHSHAFPHAHICGKETDQYNMDVPRPWAN